MFLSRTISALIEAAPIKCFKVVLRLTAYVGHVQPFYVFFQSMNVI